MVGVWFLIIQQVFRIEQSGFGDGFTAYHAGYFTYSLFFGEGFDKCFGGGTRTVLLHQVMCCSFGSYLRQMSDGDDLRDVAHFFHDLPHPAGYFARHTGINFVKNNRGKVGFADKQ